MGSGLASVIEACGDQLDRAVLARVMSTQGFGGRRTGEALIVTDSRSFGNLASGAADAEVISAARSMLSTAVRSAVVEVSVGDAAAVRSGLACGGRLTVLLHTGAALAPNALAHIASGVDMVLITDVASGETRFIASESGTSDDASADASASAVPDRWTDALTAAHRMHVKGPMGTILFGEGTDTFLIEAVASTPSLLVFGRAELADAIARVGSVLGWFVRVDPEAETESAISTSATAGPNDGVVVLSHDIAASCAVLAAALNGQCGYIGALGSRHTQAARCQHLVEHLGIAAEAAARVRGPVGLDLGARSPEETALAIVAEMLSVIRQRAASPLGRARA